MDWSNLSNNTTGSKLSTAQPASSSKLLLNMRNESPPTNSLPALFFGSRPNLPGLEDHPGSGGGLLYGNFDGSDQESADVEASDHEALHPAEKKRRLSVEQVKSLEMSFEIENKLEPERKKQLAHELGLQPRQVAVWFQNRRARWKTKQLERDYEALKASYDGLLLENKKLQAEVSSLVAKLETKAGDITQQKPEMSTAVTSKKAEELLEESVTVAVKNHEGGNLILIEDMDVVASCKPVKATEKEGSPCSDGGYTSEILDAEYPAAEPVPVVEENNDHVLTFEDQGFDMESTTVKVLKDEADGMVYDPHSNQLVLYKFEDGLVYNDYDNTSSFYYLPPDAMGPWWA